VGIVKLYFDFEAGGKQCDGCDAVFCNTCIYETGQVDLFSFRGRIRCTQCFETTPKTVISWDLLDFVIEKYNLSRRDILDNFLKTAPAWYTTPQDAYVCTQCPSDECASKSCEYVSETYFVIGSQFRGYCCKAQGKELCLGCVKWEAKRTCVAMIGVRKFRKPNLLNTLPRDVLIHCILRPWIKNRRIDIVEGGEKKRLKV
jgi:hypothetical protein